MRIAYCAHVRLPSERAHGHQIAHVCDAMIALGHEVTLFAPTRRSAITEDYHTYYGANKSVQVRYLPSFDQHTLPVGKGAFGLWLSNISLRRAFRKALTGAQLDLLYTRSPALLPSLLHTGIPVLLELHQLPRRNRKSFVHLCNNCRSVACLTSPMRDELLQWGVDPSKLFVEGDAVDATWLTRVPDTHRFRQRYEIPENVPVVGYAGQLASMGIEKGVEVLLQSLVQIHRNGMQVHALIAGGPASAQQKFEVSLSSDMEPFVHFTGSLKQQDIPDLLASCDVLVYPAPRSDHSYFQRDTSPLKLFEYMAVGKPIVCADLPPLHDVLSEEHVTFAVPGDAESFSGAIASVLSDPDTAFRKVARAKQLVASHTWEKRMERILRSVRTYS
ncbi:MAG: glycosyltransferase family 4 protein [Candidatus Peribacteraceae bacterium]|nr:glycosyltransferase family 4 protein [Candidatus Peribacteraceae bacterium]